MKLMRIIRVGPQGSEQVGDVELGALITINALARRYGISVRALHYWREARRVSYYKFGRSVRFNPAETDQDIKAFRIPARVSKY